MILPWWLSRSRQMPAPPAPETSVTAIGDIHGCASLLTCALKQADARAMGQIICVGDYVDRGPDSARVLRLLQSRPDILCLMGNHELMLLGFLNDPAQAGRRWLHYGGRETLESFGLEVMQDPDAEAMVHLRDGLRVAMGPALEDWLRGLPRYWQSGNLAITHAGADPRAPLAAQSDRALCWGHPKFGQVPRRDGLWVLRGHVIVDTPMAAEGVISIDTGAYFRGHLSLAHIAPDLLEFDTVTEPPLPRHRGQAPRPG